MALLRGLFWFALFLFFTFSFVVLFEYGTNDFTFGFKKELNRLTTFVQEAIHPTKKKLDQPKP